MRKKSACTKKERYHRHLNPLLVVERDLIPHFYGWKRGAVGNLIFRYVHYLFQLPSGYILEFSSTNAVENCSLLWFRVFFQISWLWKFELTAIVRKCATSHTGKWGITNIKHAGFFFSWVFSGTDHHDPAFSFHSYFMGKRHLGTICQFF